VPPPITTPGTYTAPGDYYLANDIVVSSGVALTFQASFPNSQRLNLNGKSVICTVPGDTRGILGLGNTNLLITGGGASWIRGFRVGVVSSRPYTRIQEVLFEDILYMGITLSGDHSRVILCSISDVGGVSDEAYSVGVNITGYGGLVRGCEFRNFYRQVAAPPALVGEGVPIILNASSVAAVVEHNYLHNDTPAASTIGIFAGAGGGHSVRNNVIRNMRHGVQSGGDSDILGNIIQTGLVGGSVGISFSSGAADDNVLIGYETPVSGPPNSNIVCEGA
jgi:hypothetical protein